MTKRIGCFFLIVLSTLSLFACAGKEIDENNPQDLLKDAEEDISDKRYTIALDKLKNIRNKFPYSHLATQAKLRIADVHFLEEAFIEAAGAYESFRDMHPKHEKADYVIFRIGESYYNQLPGTNDRDLTPGTKAIEAYRELLTLYPKSQHADQARKRLQETTDRLANKEKYVADFYFKRHMYDSAAGRYEKVASKFPGSSIEQSAYWFWAQSLLKQNKQDEAKHVLDVYVSRFPNGTYAKQAGDLLDAMSPGKGE